MEQFFINLGLSIVGLFSYSLLSVRKHIKNRTFKLSIFWNHNIIFWIWAILLQSVYVSLMSLYPGLETWAGEKLIAVVQAVVGIELNIPKELTNTVVYLSLALLLAKLVNGSIPTKDKIGTKKSL